MKKLNKGWVFAGIAGVLLVCAGALFTACATNGDKGGDPDKVRKIAFDKRTLRLTLFSSEKLQYTITPATALNQNVSWTSSDPSVVSVSDDGTVTAHAFTNADEGSGRAVITVKTEDGGFSATVTVTAVMSGEADIMVLPPLKDQFEEYFLIGNIFLPSDAPSDSAISNRRLLRHYNVLTAENEMKPRYLSPSSAGNYSWTTADRMVNAALASGFQVVGHTLLWHSQIPEWQRALASANRDTALAAMRQFITDVMTRYKGKIHTWDVLNEVFPDDARASDDWKTSMRSATRGGQGGNPWAESIGSDFVYEGFLAARRADPDAQLYYNDYNLNQVGKATLVRDMVKDVNDRYKAAFPQETRLLIDGIGMQSHHNINVTADSIRASLDLFKPLGVKIAISELDVLSQTWQQYSSGTPLTNNGKLLAANLYGEYFKVFIEYSDIIERVSFWGVFDEQSWRSRALPLIFEGIPNIKAKPAYYKIIESLP